MVTEGVWQDRQYPSEKILIVGKAPKRFGSRHGFWYVVYPGVNSHESILSAETIETLYEPMEEPS